VLLVYQFVLLNVLLKARLTNCFIRGTIIKNSPIFLL